MKIEFGLKIAELVSQLNNSKDAEVMLKLTNTELEGKLQ